MDNECKCQNPNYNPVGRCLNCGGFQPAGVYPDTQLPADVITRVATEAKQFAFYNYVAAAIHPNAKFEDWDTWPEQARVCCYAIIHYMTRPDICWPYPQPTVPMEYATKLHTARTLLEKFISRHEGGLLPDTFIYKEIKSFLDGTK
jgi:hypothetical protein